MIVSGMACDVYAKRMVVTMVFPKIYRANEGEWTHVDELRDERKSRAVWAKSLAEKLPKAFRGKWRKINGKSYYVSTIDLLDEIRQELLRVAELDEGTK